MNHDVVTSVSTFTEFIMLCSEEEESYSNVPSRYSGLAVNEFAMSFRYRDMLVGNTVQAETMTIAQATQAFKILRKLRKDRNCTEPMIFKLLVAFTALLDGYAYRESQHRDQLVSFATGLELC
jgi:hypothetical protein